MNFGANVDRMKNRKQIVCFQCHKPINGKYFLDWAGHSVCASHIIVKCASCGQFCNSKAKDIGLGLKICEHCQKFRIERKDCDAIINFIMSIYEESSIGIVSRWKLQMVNADTLYKLTNDLQTRGLARVVGNEYTIYIYRELSRVAFAQVLAHELLHVYQYTNSIYPSKDKCEGFCNLGSYVVLKAINNPEAKAAINNLMSNPDNIYGGGFRLLLAAYNEGGWKSAINLIKGR